MRERTQVGIVGAGPAGLVLSHLLHLEGIDSVILEKRSQDYVVRRVRAGVLEQRTVDLLTRIGVGDRLRHEGLVHRGIELRFDGRGHRIALSDLAGGKAITIYGQQEVVSDLINARHAAGGRVLFDVDDVTVHSIDSQTPALRYTRDGNAVEMTCDFIGGCDGFHGICRDAIPGEHLTTYEHTYPFAWVGILATVAPSTEELIYACHDRGFALHSLRSPSVSRLYVQCPPDDAIGSWSDDRIWTELHHRFATDDGWALQEGPIVEKGITRLHSWVSEPMQFGRLFLAGDAAHIVPATGAKGLNLAVADVCVLADAIAAWYRTGSRAALDRYSETCLRRVWRAQHFSNWMTMMLHRLPDGDPFTTRLQLSQLRYVTSSRAAAQSLAENYVGLDLV